MTSYLTESDYNDLKMYTLSQLEEYMEEITNSLQNMEELSQTLQGEELSILIHEMEEYNAWIKAYQDEIDLRKIPSTPTQNQNCDACKNGENNQEGHYGYCIPYPAWMEL